MGNPLHWKNQRNLREVSIQQSLAGTNRIDQHACECSQSTRRICDFGALKDQLIRDRIVCGVRDNAVRRK